MSGTDDDIIIIGTGHKRQSPDITSPVVADLKAKRQELADMRDWGVAHGDDADTRVALNDARQALQGAIDRALDLHAIVGD